MSSVRATAATRLALALGIVFDMVVKPEAPGAVVAIVVAVVIGLGSSQIRGVGARGTLAANE